MCAGCKVNYSVNIEKNLSVKESIRATESEEFFKEYTNSSIGRVVSFISAPYLETLNQTGYLYTTAIGKKDGGAIVTKDYDSIEDYVNQTIVTSQFTNERISYNRDGDMVTLSAIGKFSTSEQDQTKIYIDEASISLSIPFEVVDNNADRVMGNTYIWDFDNKNSEEREIKISFNAKVLEENKDKVNKVYLYLIIAGLIIMAIVIGIHIYNKLQEKRAKVNKI